MSLFLAAIFLPRGVHARQLRGGAPREAQASFLA
jgi:hypothetical protein